MSRQAYRPGLLAAMLHVVVPVPRLGMTPPPVVHHRRRRHRRSRCHDRRLHRRRRRWRRRRAGSQSESRDESGRAERPASRDKTHVSPPRVESDTLYQLDTQSRAAQDVAIIAPSRLFSMGNLTSIRMNDDDPDIWCRRAPRWKAQYHLAAPGRGRFGPCESRSGRPIRSHPGGRPPWLVRSLGQGRAAAEIRSCQRRNFTGGQRIR